ncbi:MAG: L,D-transpeptidase [Dehalococcoidia bacterium]
MTRSRIFRVIAAAAVLSAGFTAAAFSLRAYGPEESWNVFAAATPTFTSTPTHTPTFTPTFTNTPTPTVTLTPTPTFTPTPSVPAPNPPPVPGPEVAGERWILVDIARQTTTAMIGETALYTALVTTGKEGWETPRGSFRIQYRVENETMTSAAIGAEEYYVLEDVLWTQYFTNAGHALHLNYWRDEYYFGSIPSSHGCVGMRYADAEFFWRFARNGTRVEII